MKERIINNYGAEIKSICRGCAEGVKQKCKQTQKDHLQCALSYSELKDFKVEQVPESYEELKELVKNNIFEDDRNGVKIGERIKVEYILIDGKSFMPYGYILDEDNNVFSRNKTPAQMWQIIKNLIGE